MKTEQLDLIKYQFIFNQFLKLKFFRDYLALKCPALEEALKQLLETNPDLSVSFLDVQASGFLNALNTHFKGYIGWFKNFLDERGAIQEMLSQFDYTFVRYDAENKVPYVIFPNSPKTNTPQNSETIQNNLKTRMAVVGPPIWKNLHTYAKTWNGDIDAQKEFLNKEVQNKIPCGECKGFWLKEIKDNPPPTDSSQNFFEWTVSVHNKVNVKLEKTPITLEEALTLY